MGVNSLPKTVTRQRRGCDLNPGPTALESSTLTTRLPSHPRTNYHYVYRVSQTEILSIFDRPMQCMYTAAWSVLKKWDIGLRGSLIMNFSTTNEKCLCTTKMQPSFNRFGSWLSLSRRQLTVQMWNDCLAQLLRAKISLSLSTSHLLDAPDTRQSILYCGANGTHRERKCEEDYNK